MFERKPDLDVVFVPFEGVDPDAAVEIGARWLMTQPGQHLVLLHAKKMYNNNRNLPPLTSGALVEKPDTVWGSSWVGGAVLAPWPTERVLAALSDSMAAKVTAVCILPWGDQAHQQAWLDAQQAVNLITGEARGGPDELLDPVVRVAMQHLSIAVNHNNGLVQGYEKSYAVRTLQELRRAGYALDADALCSWALANGFTSTEVRHLREYTDQLNAGRGFRLRETVGPLRGEIERWRTEAAAHPE